MSRTVNDPQLLELREQIDQLDEQLLGLLVQRYQLTDQIGGIKQRRELSLFDPLREKEMINRYQQTAQKKGLDPVFVAQMWQVILKESKRRQGATNN